MNINNIPHSSEIIKRVLELIQRQNTRDFNKRQIGLSLKTFLISFTLTICLMKRVTLEGIALKCQEYQSGLSLSKQALHKRLGEGGKALKELLGSAVEEVICETPNQHTTIVLEQFASVIITDSTTISLPDKLEAYHKGLGGTNAKSAMKIQATFDVKSKNFRKIDIINDATANDASYMAEIINGLKPNDLSITDLGYYSVASFLKIDEKGAYFISKIKSNTILYTKEGKTIDVQRMLKSTDFIDRAVVIKGDGGKTSLTVRLCGIKLPEEVYSERLRKAKKAAGTSKTLSEEERERLKWILMVTNIPTDILDVEAICEIYRIRWQIELIFKAWKRYFAIDEMNNVGKAYWDCLLYGKLVVITMLTSLYSQFSQLIYITTGRRISLLRFMKNMREDLDIIVDYWINKNTKNEVEEVLKNVIRASLIEQRQRKTTDQVIADLDLPFEVLKMLTGFES